MIKAFLTRCKAALSKSSIKIAVVIITLAIIGFSTVGNYGLSTDEATEIAMVRRNFEFITKGQPIPSDLKYFGTVFNVTAETIFQIKEYLNKGFSYDPKNYQKDANDDQLKLKALHDRIQVKHPLTFLSSLIAYLSVAGIVGILCGWEYAWFAPIVLALFPRFWGIASSTPKTFPLQQCSLFAPTQVLIWLITILNKSKKSGWVSTVQLNFQFYMEF